MGEVYSFFFPDLIPVLIQDVSSSQEERNNFAALLMVTTLQLTTEAGETKQKSYHPLGFSAAEVVPQESGAQRKPLAGRSLSDPTRIGSFFVHILTSKLVQLFFFGGVSVEQ